MDHEPETRLRIAERRVAWVLANPHSSDWLKQALRSACPLDPIAAQNDVEMLRHLIVPLATARIEMALNAAVTSCGHDIRSITGDVAGSGA